MQLWKGPIWNPQASILEPFRFCFEIIGSILSEIKNISANYLKAILKILMFFPRPEAGIALNMRTKISMFLDDDPTTRRTITKVTLANSKKHTYWLIGSILYWRAASTCPRSTQENPAHKYSVTFEGWSSSPKTVISDNRLFVTTNWLHEITWFWSFLGIISTVLAFLELSPAGRRPTGEI